MLELNSAPFAPLRRAAAALGGNGLPQLDELQRLVDADPATRGLRLVGSETRIGELYEGRVHAGELPVDATRWHDVFNVLVWLAFPRAKRALNAKHVFELGRERGAQRGRVRDALTQFDEDGMVILSSAPELTELIRAFAWKELFWRGRSDVSRHLSFLVFGHALYEKMTAPFVGVTAKAVVLAASPETIGAPLDAQVAHADVALADLIGRNVLATPRDLQPLPVLGIPGWSLQGQTEAFYDDVRYFRPGRARS